MKKFKRVLALAMAVILSVPTIITTGMGTVPVKAAGDTVELTVSDDSAKYAGYETRKMYAGGNYAYCVQPSKKTPQSGTYEKHYDVENYVSNAGDKTQAVQSRNLAYYCWGAPGFSASYFPSTWYDGSAMDDDKYIALSHIMLSFLVSYDEVGSMHGCNSSFKNWVYQNVLGYNANGDLVNGQATLPILCWATAPASFKVYILSTGSATQNILGYEYTPTGTVSLSKTSANTGITSGNSCYSLAGAVYGIYSDAGCSAQVTTLTTDAGGNAAAVSLNAGTYYYKELTAPAGYALDSSVQSFTVTDGQNTALSVSDTPTNDPVIISINKVDSETGDKVQGGASLENAEFTVKYYAGYYNAGNLPANATRTWVIKTVKIGGVYVAGLNNTCKVSGDDFYTNAAGTAILPLGTISIEETKAPEGYNLEGAYLQVGGVGEKITGKYVAQITQNGNLASLKGGNTFKVSDKIKRGDFKLTKIDTDNQNRMSDIPFRVTNKATGESHIIKTDENGYFSSESSWNAHSKNTNGGGAYDGLWFSSADGSAKVDDSVGAMPYGDYTLEELSCDNNKGKILYKGEFSIRRDKVTVDIGTIENHSEPTPVITTQASDAKTQYQIIKPSADTDIIDKVTITDTMAGRDYTITGTLMDKDTGEAVMVNGNPVTASQTFTSDGTKKVLDMHFNFDSSALGGKTVVVCEKLTYGDYVAATEEDMENKDQTIYFPEIHTTATDSETADHLTLADSRAVITDTVTYTNLLKGETYTLSGVLMDKETGKELLIDGEPVTQEMAFTAGRASGTKKLKFEFDTTGLAGKSFVVYETLTLEDVEVAEHKDINDEGQTIHIPAAQTTATDDSSKINVSEAKKEISVTDTVAYRNLVPGKEYTVRGTAVDKETGEPLTDADGNELVSTAKFTAASADGSVDVKFTFDGTAMAGRSVVFFENVYYTDKLIAVHADIDDEAQTVHIPLIFTSVKDKDTDSHMSLAGSDVTLTDTVAYRNLVPGKTYTISGTLMDQRTGKAVTVNGKAVTSSADFTPDTADGETKVDFNFNTKGLDDTTVVVFETMFYGKAEIAAHINDKGQTIYIPSVKTTAIDEKTATKLTLAEKDIHIVDKVAYRNLVPGEKYTVTGTAIDKTTGEPLKDDAGKDVTAKASFKAEKANGTVDVEFVFDGSTLAGKTVVMYENIYYNNKLVGVHADISDEAQIIYVPSVKTAATDTKTETKLTYAEKDIKITDTVEYTNLIPGKTYKVTGTAMDKKTGKVIKDADGKAVTSEAEITPETADGKVDVDFIFDGSNLAGKTIVMFEEIRYENRLVGVHTDINDEAQTIYVPAIATEALDEVTGIHLSNAGDDVKVKDTVTYKNLIPGLTYRVAGTVMDKDTKKPLQNGGKDITAEAVFTPETADGTVDVEFTFSAKEFAGKTMVLFEKLYLVKNADNADANPDDTSSKDKTPDDTQKASESENTQNKTDNTSNKVEVDNENNNPADNSEVKEVLIAVHEDYSDENQTICVPQIKTTAKDAKSGTSMFYAEKSAKIVDTVSYRNLVPGKKYKVVGTAVDKSNGAPVIANGNNVTAEAEFVAKEATGKVDVVFTFDASLLAGRTIVMFEDVYYENNLIATHADITDEAQTLYVPKIGTTAIDGERKDHSSTADSSVTIVDSVAYRNLVQGQTYRVTGKLMDKATGKALVIDGKEVTAVTEFTAAGTEGVVDVTFRFNGKGMTGKQLVVFEQLDVVTADGAYAIASHNDINDAAQTITMIAPPKPKTGDYMSVVMYVLAGIAGVMAVICSFFTFCNEVTITLTICTKKYRI